MKYWNKYSRKLGVLILNKEVLSTLDHPLCAPMVTKYLPMIHDFCYTNASKQEHLKINIHYVFQYKCKKNVIHYK
jgi:hypothetical protein